MFFVAFMIKLTACTEHSFDQATLQSLKDSTAIPKDSTLYFPQKPKRGRFDSSFHVVALDSFRNKWYSDYLYGFKEPILRNYPVNREAYRFIYLRSFDLPIVIRLEKVNTTAFLNVKISDGQGGYELGNIHKNEIIPISSSQWKKFQSNLQELQFWQQSPEDTNWRRLGMDGARWILEGKKEGKYHFVDRWSPEEKEYAKFKAVCEYLISLAKLDEKELPADRIY